MADKGKWIYKNTLLSYIQAHDEHQKEMGARIIMRKFRRQQIRAAKRILFQNVKTDVVPTKDDYKDIIDVFLTAEPNTLPKFVRADGTRGRKIALSVFDEELMQGVECEEELEKSLKMLVHAYEKALGEYTQYEMRKVLKHNKPRPIVKRRHSE